MDSDQYTSPSLSSHHSIRNQPQTLGNFNCPTNIQCVGIYLFHHLFETLHGVGFQHIGYLSEIHTATSSFPPYLPYPPPTLHHCVCFSVTLLFSTSSILFNPHLSHTPHIHIHFTSLPILIVKASTTRWGFCKSVPPKSHYLTVLTLFFHNTNQPKEAQAIQIQVHLHHQR